MPAAARRTRPPSRSATARPAPAGAPPFRDEPGEDSPLGLFTTLARTELFLDALQRECLGEHGLAFTEYSVLRLLQRAPDRRLPPSVLADRIVCTTGAMTKLVDRLERAGLVQREPDPEDRRSVRVALTSAGHRRAQRAARAYTAGRRRVLARLDPREAERIHAGLLRLLDAFEADHDEA